MATLTHEASPIHRRERLTMMSSTSRADPVTIGVLVLPMEPWADLVARWQRLEAAGVDSIWSCDHFTNPHRPGEPWFEGWAGLTGLAAATQRVRVGLLVGAIVSRSPTLLAKQAQVVDHLTGGRLDIGLGAGGAPTDQPMWGVEEWSPRERAERFAEYVDLVDRLTREDEVTAPGRWYRADGAVMAPGFVQRPRPPFTLAAHGPRTMAVAARHADTWNTFGPGLDDGRQLSAELDVACAAIGRDPATIRRSVLLGLTDGTAWTTAAELADRVREWHTAGFREVIFYDPPYARAGVPCAPPEAVDEVLANLTALRGSPA
jgi:alkanesulfonate monooxygenase SsuD/methylene tetrahydromethanopterin reductase-like flavin-dependent oxidoreductase (luciferase family)